MNICDDCKQLKPRRQIKVKDLAYKGPIIEYHLCENCYRKTFATMIKNRSNAGGYK